MLSNPALHYPSAFSLARELGQALLVRLNSLHLRLAFEVLLRGHQEKRNFPALGARPADVFLGAFALTPRTEAFFCGWHHGQRTGTDRDRRGGGIPQQGGDK